jgi:FdrA protein
VRRCKKPVVACFFGEETVSTLDEAVCAALGAAGEQMPQFLKSADDALRKSAASERAKMRPAQRYIRGFFAGGTLCYQAQSIFRRAGLPVYSNAPLCGMRELTDPNQSREHTFVDMGAEFFVQGRPHPMIDGTLRRKRLEQEARDPSVAVVLLDFVLGSIASPDPVGDLLATVRSIRANGICVAASVCGTNEDRQSLEMQERSLKDAGALVFASSAQAASFCREAALQLRST